MYWRQQERNWRRDSTWGPPLVRKETDRNRKGKWQANTSTVAKTDLIWQLLKMKIVFRVCHPQVNNQSTCEREFLPFSSLPQYVFAESAAIPVVGVDVFEGTGWAEGRSSHLPLQPAAADRHKLERRSVPRWLQGKANDARGSETQTESRKKSFIGQHSRSLGAHLY